MCLYLLLVIITWNYPLLLGKSWFRVNICIVCHECQVCVMSVRCVSWVSGLCHECQGCVMWHLKQQQLINCSLWFPTTLFFSVLFCWCHSSWRPGEEYSWTQRNGRFTVCPGYYKTINSMLLLYHKTVWACSRCTCQCLVCSLLCLFTTVRSCRTRSCKVLGHTQIRWPWQMTAQL